MSDPVATVTTFLAECGRDKASMQKAFRAFFTAATVWENVGFATTTGPDEGIALMENFEQTTGIVTFRARLMAVAAQDNKVLTERHEELIDAAGGVISTMPIMGIFEIDADKIAAWRDYYDTASMAAAMAAAAGARQVDGAQ